MLWERLSAAAPELVRISPAQGCLPNTLLVLAPGRLGADVLEATPEVAASTGSACHAGEHSPSSAVLAMGIDHDTALGAIRLSTGRTSTREGVEQAATSLARALAVHRR